MALLVACGGGSEGGADAGPGAGTVAIELENNTPAAFAPAWHAYSGNETPDDFAVALLGVTLDGAGDGPALVYLHPACAELASCAPADVSELLEIQRPSADVNQELAAPEYAVGDGDYTVVRLHWASAADVGARARYRMDEWQAGASKDIVWGDQPITDVVPARAITVGDGVRLRLTLQFNLDRMVLRNQGIDGCAGDVDPSCYSEGDQRWFIVGRPEFGARATEIAD